MSELVTPWAGRWGWVYRSGFDRKDIGEVSGWSREGGVGLPPEFVAFGDTTGLWARINLEIGSLIDIFEDDEITDQESLLVSAQIIDDATANTEHGSVGSALAGFLRYASLEGFSVEFWL